MFDCHATRRRGVHVGWTGGNYGTHRAVSLYKVPGQQTKTYLKYISDFFFFIIIIIIIFI